MGQINNIVLSVNGYRKALQEPTLYKYNNNTFLLYLGNDVDKIKDRKDAQFIIYANGTPRTEGRLIVVPVNFMIQDKLNINISDKITIEIVAEENEEYKKIVNEVQNRKSTLGQVSVLYDSKDIKGDTVKDYWYDSVAHHIYTDSRPARTKTYEINKHNIKSIEVNLDGYVCDNIEFMGEIGDVSSIILNYSSVEEAIWTLYTTMSIRTTDGYWWEFVDEGDANEVKDRTELLSMVVDYIIENLKDLYLGNKIYDIVAFIVSASKEYGVYDRIMSILNKNKGGDDGGRKNNKDTKK